MLHITFFREKIESMSSNFWIVHAFKKWCAKMIIYTKSSKIYKISIKIFIYLYFNCAYVASLLDVLILFGLTKYLNYL